MSIFICVALGTFTGRSQGETWIVKPAGEQVHV